ncbi:MAG: cobaltochelatase subunit CobT, partial [Pseudomonadota bacterium]
IKTWAERLQPVIGKQLDDLGYIIDNQQEYALAANKIITTIAESNNKEGNDQSSPKPDSESENQPQDKTQEDGKNRQESQVENPENISGQGEKGGIENLLPDKTLQETGQKVEGDVAVHNINNFTKHEQGDGQNIQEYKVFSRNFDEVIDADKLSTPEEITRLRYMLDQKLVNLHSVTSKLANRLQHLLFARLARNYNYELEEGEIDSRKLAKIISDPTYSYLYKQEEESKFRDTIVTLLIDNSGSMRGRPITVAAICADILARTLERCNVKVEILGFTTRDWKGGQSRKLWQESGQPANPGRLNDLRHIIYKSADMRWQKARKNIGIMLKDGILKENIDGESIIWAY